MRILQILTTAFLLSLSFVNISAQYTNIEVPLSMNNSGEAPHASALLDVNSTDKGILVPRMNTTQMMAIDDPATSLLVYNITENQYMHYDGDAWVAIADNDDPLFGIENELIYDINYNQNNSFLIGAASLPDANAQTDNMMFFDRSKSAFRVGKLTSSVGWQPNAIGEASVAMGHNTIAEGESSIALGYETKASGNHSMALGFWNDPIVTAGANISAASPLLTIGNGTSTSNRSNALTTYYDGHTKINGSLILNETSSIETEGTIRWNSTTKDFEGYDGSAWRSLTSGCSSSGSSNTAPLVTPMCCAEQHTGSYHAANNRTGSSVAIDGNFALINGPGVHFFIFKYDGNNWTETDHLTNSGGSAITSLDLDGDLAVIGSFYSKTAAIYKIAPEGTGKLLQTITEPNISAFDIDMSGNIVAFTTNTSKRIKLYKMNPNDEKDWSLLTTFIPDDLTIQDIDINGDRLVVGTRDGGTMERGAIYIYRGVGSVWGLETILESSSTIFDDLGSSVAVSGNYIAAGDPNADTLGHNSGAIGVFKYDGSKWTEHDILIASDGYQNLNLGESIAMAGDYIITGCEALNDKGLVYVYHYNGTNWVENEKISDPIGADNDQFGWEVDTDGANRIIGAPHADVNGNLNGGKVEFGPID